MYKLRGQNGKLAYGICSFTVDAVADLADIKITGCAMGSTAYVIADGSTYILNGNKEWVLYTKTCCSGSSSGGGSSSDDDDDDDEYDVIYDGGTET